MQMVSGEHTAASGPACKVDKQLRQLFRYHNNTPCQTKTKTKAKTKTRLACKVGQQLWQFYVWTISVLSQKHLLILLDKQRFARCIQFWVSLFPQAPQQFYTLVGLFLFIILFFFFSFSPLLVRSCMSALMEWQVTRKPYTHFATYCTMYFTSIRQRQRRRLTKTKTQTKLCRQCFALQHLENDQKEPKKCRKSPHNYQQVSKSTKQKETEPKSREMIQEMKI